MINELGEEKFESEKEDLCKHWQVIDICYGFKDASDLTLLEQMTDLRL